MKWPWINLTKPYGAPAGLSADVTSYARVGLDILVMFNVLAQVVLVVVLFMGANGAQVAPIAGGATVALFMLMYFYARWMLPYIKGWHVLMVMLLKEVVIIVLLGLAVGVTMLIRWLAGI